MAATTIPATVWSPPSNDGEYSLGTADTIVDSSSNNIVDSSTNNLASTDTSFTQMPVTTWTANDGS